MSQSPEKSFAVSLGLLNKLVNYLSTRPYAEVYSLLEDIKTTVSSQSTPTVVPEESTKNVA